MPVLVWVYGGGFQMGEASRDLYSPDYIMMENVVLVTISYRLGPLGRFNIILIFNWKKKKIKTSQIRYRGLKLILKLFINI